MRLGNSALLPLEGGTGEALLCLVGRELCLFMDVNAERVPAKQRREYVAMAVRRAAPYADPDFGLAWLGDHAAVWYWSRARVLDRLGGHWPRRITCAPEALYVGQAHDDQAELLALEDGCEGRLWKQSRLLASRWWPQPPDHQQWQGFLRGAGMPYDSDAPPPVAAAAPIQVRHWSGQATGRTGLALSGLETHLPRLLLGLGLATVLVFTWQIGSIARAGFDAWRAQAAAQDLDESLTRIMAARDRADTAQTEITALLALRNGQSQYRLLAEVAGLMQGKSWQLKVWQQPVADRVEASLIMESPDPEALVAAWEASPLFSDVRTELSRQQNEIIVRATVAPIQDAAP